LYPLDNLVGGASLSPGKMGGGKRKEDMKKPPERNSKKGGTPQSKYVGRVEISTHSRVFLSYTRWVRAPTFTEEYFRNKKGG